MTKSKIKPIEKPSFNPPESITKISDEPMRYSDFGELAKLAMILRDSARDEAEALAKTVPHMSRFYEGAAHAFYICWHLLYEQSQKRIGEVAPGDYAIDLAEPMVNVIKSIASGAEAGYRRAMENAAHIARGTNGDED
jgi:hypothetical protein